MPTASTSNASEKSPDPGVAYQAAYDALGKAYWDASDIAGKDQIFAAHQALGDLLTAINQQQLAANTDLFKQLTPKIKDINTQLGTIKDQIAKITKNVHTAGVVVAAITKVLALYPKLL